MVWRGFSPHLGCGAAVLPAEHQLKDLQLVVVVIAASTHHPKHHRARGPPDRLQGRRRVHAQPELAAEAGEVFDARPQPGDAPARRRVSGVDEQHAVEVEEQGNAPQRAGRKVPRGAAGGDPALRGGGSGGGVPGAAGVGVGVAGVGGSATAASVAKGIGFVVLVVLVYSSLHGAQTRLSLRQSLNMRVIDAQARRDARRRSIRRAIGRGRSSIHIGVVGISPMLLLLLRRLPLERDDVAQGDDGRPL